MAWVREPANLVIIAVQDFNGKTATTQYFVDQSESDPSAGAPAALADAVQGITYGAVTQVGLLSRATQSTPGNPTTGPYDRVADKLKLELACADGSKLTLQLPSPLASTLGSSNFRVNPAATNIAALVNALKTNGRSAQGAAIVALSGGYRRVPPRLVKKT